MAQRVDKKNRRPLPLRISPLVWGYLGILEKQGVHVSRAYVFGSWAKKKAHRWSDIDLAIVSPQFTSWTKKFHSLAKAARIDFAEIEAHGFTPQAFADASNPVVHEIKKYGIRII